MPRRPKYPKPISLAEKEEIVRSTGVPMFDKSDGVDWGWLKAAVLAGNYPREDYVRRRLEANLVDDLPPVEIT